MARRGRLRQLYASSVGKKAVAAVTGVVLLGFLVLHVSGNFKAFAGTSPDGPPAMDVYAEFLREVGEPLLPRGALLWGVRVVLLGAAVLHVVAVSQLAARNRAARPRAHARRRYQQASVPARWMLASGVFLLVFLVIHILHFTTGTLRPGRFVPMQVYANLWHAFQIWWVALFYAVAMTVLALHLFHGAWSLFQSLGVDNPDRNRALRGLAVLLALGLFVGFASVPAAFWLGLLPPPDAAIASLAGGR